MRFFKVTEYYHGTKLIAANNEYEAVGYYALFVMNGTGELDDITYEEAPADHKIEISCIGFPVYQTTEEMFAKLNDHSVPTVLCGLVD